MRESRNAGRYYQMNARRVPGRHAPLGHALQVPDTVAKRKSGLSVVHSGGIGGRRATPHAAAAHTASQSQADRRTDANAFEDGARRRTGRAAINDGSFVGAALFALVGAL